MQREKNSRDHQRSFRPQLSRRLQQSTGQKPSGQGPVGRNQQSTFMECNALVDQLSETMSKEKANCSRETEMRMECSRELEEMREQWKRQKTLKEMYINREKETKRELERVKKYSNEETLSAARIATQVREQIKHKKKKDLQEDYELLKVAYEKATAELQVEKDKNLPLQQEVERVSQVYLDLNYWYHTDLTNGKQQYDTLQCELQKENMDKLLLQKKYEELQVAQQLSQAKFATELEVERTKNRRLQEELERLSLKHESEVMSVRQQVDLLQCEREEEMKQNKLLQKQCEELELTSVLTQVKFAAVLQVERENTKLLHDDLERTRLSHQEISQRYETEVVPVRHQAETLQCELQAEIKSHAGAVAEGRRLSQTLAERDALCQKMAEEISTLQQNALDREKCFWRELEELKTQLSSQISINLELSTQLQADRDDCETLSKNTCEQQEPTPHAPSVTPTEKVEVPEEEESTSSEPALEVPEKPTTRSFWKTTRHFLGLKKRQKKKKKD